MPSTRSPRPPLHEDDTTVQTSQSSGEDVLFVAALVQGMMSARALSRTTANIVGRSSRAALQIDDASVSREHAALHLRSDGVSIEDLESKNGTFVRKNGGTDEDWERVVPHTLVPLSVGSSARVGVVSLIVWSEPPKPNSTSQPPPAFPGGLLPGTILDDPEMQRIHALLARIAPSEISVLLLGETGVGKEVLTEQLHRWSRRSSGPLVRVNCAAIAESLFESELFGHEKGAFTGADKAKTGLLEAANTGTLLLDEVGELPLAMQAKLLRVLEERSVRRVGSVTARPLDVRVVAATHRNLSQSVEAGTFRRDLFHRLEGIALHVPPLRQRRSEVVLLAQKFAHTAASRTSSAVPTFDPGALTWMRSHAWPGNIRELRNAVERAVLLCNHGVITREDLVPSTSSESTASVAESLPTETTAEKQRVLDALVQAAGNQTRAAELLGISRRTLVNRLDEFEIARPRKGS